MYKELKPCPFCGGKAELIRIADDPFFYPECEKCGANLYGQSDPRKARELWNTRAERTCVIKPDDSVITYCSSCDAMFAFDYFEQKWNYCPNCGAKVMKE